MTRVELPSPVLRHGCQWHTGPRPTRVPMDVDATTALPSGEGSYRQRLGCPETSTSNPGLSGGEDRHRWGPGVSGPVETLGPGYP